MLNWTARIIWTINKTWWNQKICLTIRQKNWFHQVFLVAHHPIAPSVVRSCSRLSCGQPTCRRASSGSACPTSSHGTWWWRAWGRPHPARSCCHDWQRWDTRLSVRWYASGLSRKSTVRATTNARWVLRLIFPWTKVSSACPYCNKNTISLV